MEMRGEVEVERCPVVFVDLLLRCLYRNKQHQTWTRVHALTLQRLRSRPLLLFEAFTIPITQEIKHVLTTVCLHIDRKAHTASNLNFIVIGAGLLKVTGTHVHVHCKSGDISQTVLSLIEML